MRQASQRIALALRHLGLLPQPTKQLLAVRGNFDHTGMAQEWYQWCMSWYEQAVDRWLQEQHPEIHTPEQWTEELAFRFRSDLCSWTTGQYVGDFARRTLKTKGKLASPIKPQGV